MSRQGDQEHYSMVLEWDPEDEIYVVSVPELPGCRSHGTTPEAAAEHGKDAIESWLEAAMAHGRPIPAPIVFSHSRA